MITWFGGLVPLVATASLVVAVATVERALNPNTRYGFAIATFLPAVLVAVEVFHLSNFVPVASLAVGGFIGYAVLTEVALKKLFYNQV